MRSRRASSSKPRPPKRQARPGLRQLVDDGRQLVHALGALLGGRRDDQQVRPVVAQRLGEAVVGAEVWTQVAQSDALPDQEQRDHQHPDLVPLVRRAAGEDEPASASGLVDVEEGEQLAAHEAAGEVLGRHADLAGVPALADLDQRRRHHAEADLLDAVHRERLAQDLVGGPDVEREQRAGEVVGQRAGRAARLDARRGGRDDPVPEADVQQPDGVADREPLVGPALEPADRRDVLIRVEALVTRQPARLREAVATLPGPEGGRSQSGLLLDGGGVVGRPIRRADDDVQLQVDWGAHLTCNASTPPASGSVRPSSEAGPTAPGAAGECCKCRSSRAVAATRCADGS